MHQFNADMAKYFREELGCKQLINAGNWRTNDPLLSQDAEYWSYTANDIVARNVYTGGSHAGVQAGWNIKPGDVYTDVSMTLEPVKLPTNLKRPVGRPFIIPETSWTPPTSTSRRAADDRRADVPERREWRVLVVHRDGLLDQEHDLQVGVEHADAAGAVPAAALIYRQGLVRRGSRPWSNIARCRTLDRKTPIISEESGWDPNRDTDNITMKSAVKTAADPLAYLVGPVRVVYDSDPAKTTVLDLAKFIDREKKMVMSDTGRSRATTARGLPGERAGGTGGGRISQGGRGAEARRCDDRLPERVRRHRRRGAGRQTHPGVGEGPDPSGTTCRRRVDDHSHADTGADKKETDAWRIVSTGVSAGPWQWRTPRRP